MSQDLCETCGKATVDNGFVAPECLCRCHHVFVPGAVYDRCARCKRPLSDSGHLTALEALTKALTDRKIFFEPHRLETDRDYYDSMQSLLAKVKLLDSPQTIAYREVGKRLSAPHLVKPQLTEAFAAVKAAYAEAPVSLRPDAAYNHPAHYGGAGNVYETARVIEAWGLGWHLGDAVKYLSRAGKKDPSKEVEDLEKACWYVRRRIALLKGELAPGTGLSPLYAELERAEAERSTSGLKKEE